MEWVSVKVKPSEEYDGPLLIYRDSPFKYGLQYKVVIDDEGSKEWRLDPCVTHYSIPQPPNE